MAPGERAGVPARHPDQDAPAGLGARGQRSRRPRGRRAPAAHPRRVRAVHPRRVPLGEVRRPRARGPREGPHLELEGSSPRGPHPEGPAVRWRAEAGLLRRSGQRQDVARRGRAPSPGSSTRSTASFVAATDIANARSRHRLGDGDPPLINAALRTGVLLLDDLGYGYEPPSSAIPEVIASRHAKQMPTWITTGLRGKELSARYGGGFIRRITERAVFIQCGERWTTPPNRRGRKSCSGIS